MQDQDGTGGRWRVALSERVWVALVLGVALAQGLLHVALIPPWQHYDEPTHFEYAWLIADRGRLPTEQEQDRTLRRELAASMIEHRFYHNLPRPDLLTDDGEIRIGISELDHPPAYYALVSLPLRLVHHLNVATQLYVARMVSLALFLLVVVAAAGLAREVVPPAHPLRWLLPLTVALWPPFASHLTAVNNDAGAVLMVSLFLWGAVRLLRRGLTVAGLLWVVGAAGLGALMKNTAALALLLLPVLVGIALWKQRGWRWRWLWLGGVAAGLTVLVALVGWGDAAYWYREEFARHQVAPTRATFVAPLPTALQFEISPEDPFRRLTSPLLPASVRQMRGQTVTVGGWLWADGEGTIRAPGLLLGPEGSTDFIPLGEPLPVSPTPTFFAHSYWIPPDIGVAYYTLWAEGGEPRAEPLTLYLSGAFLVLGELPADLAPRYEAGQALPDGVTGPNLLRNPSAAQTWPRLRPWVHQALERYSRRSPTYVFGALLDIQKSAPFLLGSVAPWLVEDFFSAFGWGHVRLGGAFWRATVWAWLAVALLGALRWLWLARRPPEPWRWPALGFLALFTLAVWLNALLWPLPFNWARVQLPSARYLYVAMLPLALLLVGGWWTLWPRGYRFLGTITWLVLLALFNLAALATILSYPQW